MNSALTFDTAIRDTVICDTGIREAGTFDSVLGELAPIGLDELNAQASLLSRVDRKYAVCAAEATQILDELSHRTAGHAPVQVLQIGDVRSHTYASHYFDTPAYESFYAAAHRHRRRFKVRIRHYRDSDTAFVEVKTQGTRGRTAKERLPYPADLARRSFLNLPALVWVHEHLERALCPVDVAALRPSLHGTFQRSTLLLPGSESHGTDGSHSARATIDTGLAWSTPAGKAHAGGGIYRNPSLVIIETKSPSAPSSLDRLLWSRGIRPTRISKYATALCVMHPELAQNRWHQTILRHFPESHPLNQFTALAS